MEVNCVNPNPTLVSTALSVAVSFVREFCGSFISTLPIVSERANDFEAFGSDTGLSLFVWGYKF